MLMIDVFRREVLTKITAAIGLSSLGAGRAVAQEVNEYNVGTASPAAEQAASDVANEVSQVLNWDGDEKTITGVYSQEAIDNLDNRPDVRYTEINGTYQAISETRPWGIDRVDADVAHSNDETGGDDTDGEGGAHVSIIDSGVDYGHGDLTTNYIDGKDFVNDDGDAMDDNGHGTHVAGTGDAEDNDQGVIGVCTAAHLHAAKVLNSDGYGSWSNIAAGIKWTADQGHDVGNLSLGGTSGSRTVRDACQYAYDNGVLLVAAAGNEGPSPNSVLYPAVYEEVIAVSATDRSDDIARFSSTGPEIELAAPGVNVLSTTLGGGTGEKSGTSMASPHVAGAGGQLMDNGYTNREARTKLRDTAEDIGLSSTEQGHGLVNVAAALSDDSNSSPTVDSLSLTEVETDNDDAEFDVGWQVSDSDGDLDSVDLTLTDDTDGETEDTASIDVSDDSASDTTRLVASGDDGSSNSYTAELIVTDTNGASSSDTATETESEDTTDASAPTIDSFSVSTRTTGVWFRAESDWAVSDDDGDLDAVTTELLDSDQNVLDSTSSNVSGSNASGSHEVRTRNSDSDVVRLTVTDAAGNHTSDTRDV
ncbi:S8 family serine peptidase [Halalkalicoccus ordinarius]|uniref:S8 family serine peptidase n=1 Tax=Halalkalicoccus ordinarius TaxID=3116651 RepID=UPI00300E8EDC